jgi:pimeloyl-ACP methyl ester carboxylesterase
MWRTRERQAGPSAARMAGFFLSLAQPGPFPHRERLPHNHARPPWLWSLRSSRKRDRIFAGERPPNLRPVEAPTLGIWSTNDHYLDGERMKMSGRFVKGAWRYEQIEGASHWIPLDAPDRLNHLLIEWLG